VVALMFGSKKIELSQSILDLLKLSAMTTTYFGMLRHGRNKLLFDPGG
jgi:hypothetical protein